MRAVWSFWSLPYRLATARTWCTPFHHLLAWGVSLNAAQRHYPETVLITDTYGKTLLIDELGLHFTDVSTELDRLNDADPQWWALGKLIAYGMQDQPFVHIDTDVFLWQPLPTELSTAQVFAQNPEYCVRSSCRALEVEDSFAASKIELPAEWQWAVSRDLAFIREENCGILGGMRTDFIRYYARKASDLILRPEYANAWARCCKSNLVMEQFFLAACADFHRFHPESPYRGVTIQYLFQSWDEAFDPAISSRAGFTHLLAEAKSSIAVGKRIEERVRRDDPDHFRRSQVVARMFG